MHSGPAVLVECGYLSNPSEAAILYDGDFQNQLAAQSLKLFCRPSDPGLRHTKELDK